MKNEKKEYLDSYVKFLTAAKTERRAYAEAVKLLEAAGFRNLEGVTSLKPGDKVWRGYHGKTVFAAVVGAAGSAAGVKVVGGHTDAPRLDLKPKPLYEKGGITYFDTHIYGGIKKYQWLTLPLALYGTVVKKDGTKVEIALGDEPDDPVLMISDILPHFGKAQMEKKASDLVAAEDMDVIAGVVDVAKLLEETRGVTKDDLASAELEIVPAGAPRYVGLDRALITAYGHDDRVCAFAGLAALLDTAKAGRAPARTCVVLLCDKEEIGSVGASGMESTFFENSIAELLERESAGGARDIAVRRALERSQMLSADVCAASDPHFPDADSTGNEARLGKGPCMIKYTGAATKAGASDARAEFIAELRGVMDGAGVTWQIGELGRAEKGGGGTIAKFMARYGMDVIDFGTPLLNMHAPWEIASADDCWQTMRAYRAFFLPRTVVAIDGPSGAGKSSVAKAVAAELGALHVDSGALYRIFTRQGLKEGVDFDDEAAVAACAEKLKLEARADGARVAYVVDGAEVPDAELRTPEVNAHASQTARVKAVREKATAFLRTLVELGDLVVEGRDITSVVFPDTKTRFFITASAEARAARRQKQEVAEGVANQSVDAVKASLLARDAIDSTRAHAPLKKVDGVTEIDTTDLAFEQVVGLVLEAVKAAR